MKNPQQRTPAIESELKFALDPGQARKLLKSASVKRAAKGKAQKRHLVSTYFDTRQHALRKAGGTLRVRQSDAGFEQTIKLPAPGPLGMQNYEEWNAAVPGPIPELGLFDPLALGRLGRKGRQTRLLPVFTTEVERTAVVLSHGQTRFELDLDIGRQYNHSTSAREQAVCEVEFEMISGAPVHLLDFILELSATIDLRPLYLTKAQRGYALARPSLRPRRNKAKSVSLDMAMSVGEAFQYIVGEALGQLQSNQQPSLEGEPGGIHQARVAVRRIRAALRAFKKVLPYDKRKAFNGELRWFQARLAPARDWHVFLSETLPRMASDTAEAGAEAELARLRRLALRERRSNTAEARTLFASQRYTRLVLQFQRWLLALESEHPSMFSTPLKPFATEVLEKTRRDFLLDRRPLSRMSEEDRHSLRKRGKKARYAMEFFASLWQGPAVERYLKLMQSLQERLGESNDAVVARLLMASLRPKKLAPSALLLVQNWSQSRESQCNRAGQPVWRGIQRATPFWH